MWQSELESKVVAGAEQIPVETCCYGLGCGIERVERVRRKGIGSLRL